MVTKAATQQKLEAQLAVWDKQLTTWIAKTRQATGATRMRYENDLDSLQSKRNRAHVLIMGLNVPNGNSPSDLQDAIEHTCHEIEEAFIRAAVRFL